MQRTVCSTRPIDSCNNKIACINWPCVHCGDAVPFVAWFAFAALVCLEIHYHCLGATVCARKIYSGQTSCGVTGKHNTTVDRHGLQMLQIASSAIPNIIKLFTWKMEETFKIRHIAGHEVFPFEFVSYVSVNGQLSLEHMFVCERMMKSKHIGRQIHLAHPSLIKWMKLFCLWFLFLALAVHQPFCFSASIHSAQYFFFH